MGFGNGAFQAAKISIDGVTIIQNIETGKIQTSGQGIINQLSTSYMTIPITNNQNVATPAPFQQMIQLNLSNYSQLKGIAWDLSNIYFSSDTAGQNKLYSWRETPASLTETQTWWVLLPDGIPAYGTVTIYLQVASVTELDGDYTGEAPQLSSTYGQYDNGASVFSFYDNFAGTSLSSKWSVTGLTASVNNGLTLTGSNNNPSHIVTSSTFSQNSYVVDFWGNWPTQTSGSWSATAFGYNQTAPYYGNNGQALGVAYGSGYPPSFQGDTYIYSLYETSSGSYLYGNYTTQLASSTSTFTGTYSWGWSQQASTTQWNIQWARMRTLPPNGVMPALQTTSITSSPPITSIANIWTASQIFTAPSNINVEQSTLNGTTAGSITYFMPFQGNSYKKFIAYVNGYENDTTTSQSITFPTAFLTVAGITFNSTGLTLSTSLTALTISAPNSTTTYTGMIIIEGY